MFWRKQRECRHPNARGIYGEVIRQFNYKRGYCPDCKMFLSTLPKETT